MDKNKLIKLREISYKILAVCGYCEHGNFKSQGDFGTCNIHFYIHKKHQNKRNLSIHKYGICNNGYKSKSNPELKLFSDYL